MVIPGCALQESSLNCKLTQAILGRNAEGVNAQGAHAFPLRAAGR